MKHDKYKHWTQAGTLSTLSDFQIGELEKTHSVEVYHRRVMVRKKPNRQLTLRQPLAKRIAVNDFARQDYTKQRKGLPVWVHRIIRKFLLVIIAFELAMGYATFTAKHPIEFGYVGDLSPLFFTEQELTDFYERNKPKVTPAYAEGSVEEIIRKHFGDEAEMAICIARNESGLNPKSKNTARAKGSYKGECSIGIYQINLKSDGCNGRNVHYAKVEGQDIEEKISNLENAEYNIKFASQLKEAWGSWNPWLNSYRKCKNG